MVKQIDPEFKGWLELAYPRLVEAVRRTVGERPSGEDILHDVFLHLIEKRSEITSAEMLVAYGIRLARWRSIDVYRRQGRETSVGGLGELDGIGSATGAESPEATVLARSHLAHQLSRLTPREREVMSLALDGRGSDQIARDLGIAAATVRSLLRHGRYQLTLADSDDLHAKNLPREQKRDAGRERDDSDIDVVSQLPRLRPGVG